MAQFVVNPHRADPYKNFKFRVTWDGRAVAGISRISGLKRITEAIPRRTGGEPSQNRIMPGATTFEPITMERGLTHDTEFEDWAEQVWKFGAGLGDEMSLRNFRKDIRIDFMNEAGQIALAYNIYRCWVSEYIALPELDANANTVAIERIVLQHEGFLRDRDVREPTEA